MEVDSPERSSEYTIDKYSPHSNDCLANFHNSELTCTEASSHKINDDVSEQYAMLNQIQEAQPIENKILEQEIERLSTAPATPQL